MTKKVLFIIMLLSAMGIRAQEIIKCSPGKTFWLIKESGQNYALALPGEVKESNHPKVIVADGKTLQYLVIDKKDYIEQADSNEDIKVLAAFIGSETSYLVSQFRANLDAQMELVALTDGKAAIYWHYHMPAGTGDEVEMQHFLNIVEGEKIFGLGSTQFKGGDAAAVKKMLIDTMNSLQVVKDGKNLCK